MANTPWITYTDPEIARVGLSEEDAEGAGVFRTEFSAPVSRTTTAICDGTGGANFMKAVVDPKGRILGAAIVHPHAGDLSARSSSRRTDSSLGARLRHPRLPVALRNPRRRRGTR
ncbi:MAG: hypothetical protein IPL89_04420 [Acidobacteria bacterium]|nr:hypothetical protein [Acidobacteriota bacterium]